MHDDAEITRKISNAILLSDTNVVYKCIRISIFHPRNELMDDAPKILHCTVDIPRNEVQCIIPHKKILK